ncbi:hypothetical protein NWT09_14085 [Mycolicibacterium sp. jd]|uniref:hypothetical protein n=1 Tax=unclassified Mycolicibacterium TaxID=2636767 RepID=UPI00351BCBF2
MKTWPKIKLVDRRGRTVAVFERVPVFEPDDSGKLAAYEVLDLGPIKPPQSLGWAQVAPLIMDELLDFLRQFVSTHGRMPGASPDFAVADATEFIAALETALAARGLSMSDKEEHTKLLRAAARESSYYFNSCSAFRAHVVASETHFVGAPRGESEWAMAPKPASNKASARAEAELDRSGARAVLMPPGHIAEFDGTNLPAWDDVKMVLDAVAENGEAGDILTLTVDQLRRLVAQRC